MCRNFPVNLNISVVTHFAVSMINMKTIIMLLILCQTFGIALAADFFSVPEVTFQIASPDALSKLEMTLNYPEVLLKKFRPGGAVITDKKVSNNNVSFYATKSYLAIPYSVFVSGTFESTELERGCEKNEKAFEINFSFIGSDAMIEDNIDRIKARLCVKVLKANLISGVIRAKIYKKDTYSRLFGGVVKGMIEEQINPLLSALKQAVQNQKI